MISLTNSLVPLSGSHKISVTPTQKSLAGQLLKFALLLDEDYQKLANLLFDKTKTHVTVYHFCWLILLPWLPIQKDY